MNQIVINTLVYLKEIQLEIKQSELMKRIPKLGVSAVEIRREFIIDFRHELDEIRQVAEDNNLTIFYSVPDEIFVDASVNSRLKHYLEEAEQMGATAIKLNLGDYENFRGNIETELKFLSDVPVEVNVENDQSVKGGTIEPLNDFLTEVRQTNLDIKFVFDIGNWRFAGENEFDAADTIGKSTRYLHLKDVAYVDGKPTVVPLDDGDLAWRQILEMLPYEIPIAVEYPVANETELSNGIKLIRSELKKNQI